MVPELFLYYQIHQKIPKKVKKKKHQAQKLNHKCLLRKKYLLKKCTLININLDLN